MSVVKPEDEVVAIDELQFFDSNITKVISKLMDEGKKDNRHRSGTRF